MVESPGVEPGSSALGRYPRELAQTVCTPSARSLQGQRVAPAKHEPIMLRSPLLMACRFLPGYWGGRTPPKLLFNREACTGSVRPLPASLTPTECLSPSRADASNP